MMEMEFYKIIFEEVLRLSDDGFIVVDKHAIVTDINDRYSAFLGKPKEEIIGRPITDVIPNSKMADIMRNEYREELAMHKYIPGYVRDATNDISVSRRYNLQDGCSKSITNLNFCASSISSSMDSSWDSKTSSAKVLRFKVRSGRQCGRLKQTSPC